jgi:hypothetical protein
MNDRQRRAIRRAKRWKEHLARQERLQIQLETAKILKRRKAEFARQRRILDLIRQGTGAKWP